MSATTFEYDAFIPHPLDAVWGAMKRTADLDIMGGQKVVERTSDSRWVCEYDKNTHTECVAEYDEATHTVTVTEDSTAKRTDDTTIISARAAEGGTDVLIVCTVTGGFIVKTLIKLVGSAGMNKTNESIVANITAICEGREPSILSADEIDAFVKERVSELHRDDE